MALRVFNTLSGRLESFAPLGDPVRMYVCGMTPKFHPHIGHARMYVAADLIRRTLEYRGYRVQHVQNFTDIDDKIIARAREEGISAEEAARKYTDSYFASMNQLRVQLAHLYPTVTGSMPQIIAYVQGLVQKGLAYRVGGDVYFEVARFPGYGKLSGRIEDSGMVGVRKELEPGKRDPKDFALWKAAKAGEPAWASPWGPGRPGWHIECSTMVREALGNQIDIHLGAQDLIFPHHENEIAQSESFTELEPFARYWPHVGLVTNQDGEKMSHSQWNFVTLQEMLDRYEPAAVRLYLMQTHYRSKIAFSEDALRAVARSLGTLRAAYGTSDGTAAGEMLEIESEAARRLLGRFDEHLDDDFNSAGAVGVLFEAAHAVNRAASPVDTAELRTVLRRMVQVLGLPLDRERPRGAAEAAPLIDLLIEVRANLRSQGQWALADRVRDGLRERGVALRDTPEGTTWQREDR